MSSNRRLPRRAAATKNSNYIIKSSSSSESADDDDNNEKEQVKRKQKRKRNIGNISSDISYSVDEEVQPKSKIVKKNSAVIKKSPHKIKKENDVVSDIEKTASTVKPKKMVKQKRKLNDDSEDVTVDKKPRIIANTIDGVDGNLLSSVKQEDQKLLKLYDNIKENNNRYTTNNYQWTPSQLLAELQNIDIGKSNNIIKLFENDNTIPFLCRYRKELIGHDMTPDRLRDIKSSYNQILNLQLKSETIVNHLRKDDKLTDALECEIKCAKSIDELEYLYAPYKPAAKTSLYERAKELGLQEPAEQILNGLQYELRFERFVNKNVEGLNTVDKIRDGIKNVIIHIFSKNIRILEKIRQLENHQISIESKRAKETKTVTKSNLNNNNVKSVKKEEDASKFENYFDLKLNARTIKPHQVLAINRGENLKVLSAKILLPDRFKYDLQNFISYEYLNKGIQSKMRTDLIQQSFEETFTKKLHPLKCRQVRNELTKIAEQASIEVFGQNLKQLLLMSPIKGEKILGIDPGFTNGCKLAVVSECMDVLYTGVIYPHVKIKNQIECNQKFVDILERFSCKLIALGNGTACRETEFWLTDLFENGILDRNVIKYSIVSEQGASIYSCGDVAKKEFPNMNENLISAVSIARRLSDPLGELVKIEPKHLGVGMYQHDINDKLLSETLNDIVSECVSFVGVDINTASVTLLRHIAGLTSVRAENIIKYRIENGPFKCRDDLRKVKQIGPKTFTQCAGFIRIEPLTAATIDGAGPNKDANNRKYNIFDSTWIHPESYDIAEKIISKLKLKKNDIGTDQFIDKIRRYSDNLENLQSLIDEFNQPIERIKSIFDSLKRELLKDYRMDIDKKPLFKKGITKITQLKRGTCVTGAITNVTHFGCFVDIGVERDGLIHISKLNGFKPAIGDHIEAIVCDVDIKRGRIQLQLETIF